MDVREIIGRFRNKYKRGEIVVVGDFNLSVSEMKKHEAGVLLNMSWGCVGRTSIKRKVGEEGIRNNQIDHLFTERQTIWRKMT